MLRGRCLLGYCWILILSLSPSLYAQEMDLALRGRFLNAMREIDKLQGQLNVRVRMNSTLERSAATLKADYSPEVLEKLRKKGEDPAKVVISKEYAIRGDSMLEVGVFRKDISFVMAKNRDYAFQLTHSQGVDAYAISWLEQRGVNLDAEKNIEKTAAMGVAFVSGAWSFFSERISDLVGSDTFMIQKASETKLNGQTLVQIDFTRLLDSIRPGLPSLLDAYVICDPAQHWAFREYAATLTDATGKGVLRKQVFLELDLVNGIPFAKTMTGTSTRIENPDNPDNIDRGATTLEILSTDVPEASFHLSGYGLPEPKFQSRFFSSRVWYFSIAGIVCLVIALILFKRRKAG